MESWGCFSEKSGCASSENGVTVPPNEFDCKKRDSSLIVLKLGRTVSDRKRAPFCQVYGCRKDLSSSRDYHKRHKVCELHSKISKVIVDGIEQRFCQQCSRFHVLAEFDNGKRSCRKRLASHNERRRKPPLIRSFRVNNGSKYQNASTSTSSIAWRNRFSSKLLYQQKKEADYYSPERADPVTSENSAPTRSKIDEINESSMQDDNIMCSEISPSSGTSCKYSTFLESSPNFQELNSGYALYLLSSLSQDSSKAIHSSWINSNIASVHHGDHDPIVQGTGQYIMTTNSYHVAEGEYPAANL